MGGEQGPGCPPDVVGNAPHVCCLFLLLRPSFPQKALTFVLEVLNCLVWMLASHRTLSCCETALLVTK